MSSNIWTRCGASSNLRPLAVRAWRTVEAQHIVSTRALVDSAAEQALLEDLLEKGKPPLPPGPEFRGLHYLLAAPFRYPPLRHGSRFATRQEPALWYGSESLATAFAEAAYYRFWFLSGTTAVLPALAADFTAFQVPLASKKGTDLAAGPFLRFRSTIAAKADYAPTQKLGRAMREDGVEFFRYPSARDPRGGINLGVFTPRAFGQRRPARLQAWYGVSTPRRFEVSRKDYFSRETLVFSRADFEVRGRLPAPAQ